MKMLTRRNFEELTRVKQENLVSVYIPTHRTGENEDSMIHFKNELQKVEIELEKRGVTGERKSAYLKKCHELLEDSLFWRNLEEGLAVFLSNEWLIYFKLPYTVENFSMTGEQFYLIPLIQAFNQNGFYFLLALSLGDVRLFSASGSQIAEIPLDEKVPQSLEEAAGYDYEQKSLQFRTGLNQGGQGMFHGQGRGKDDRDIDREKFFRELCKHLDDMIRDYDLPLVVCSTEENFHEFRESVKYPNVYPEFVSGNPDESNESELHRKSWELIRDYFIREKEEKKNRFDRMQSQKKATSKLEKVIPKAINGGVDTLFIERGKRIWGNYLRHTNSIEFHADRQFGDECLLNKAGLATFLQGGNVYFFDKEELPDETGGPAQAIVRF